MSKKNYLDLTINYSIKTIKKKLNECKSQKPWKYQKHVEKLKRDISESTRSISQKTIKHKNKTPPKKSDSLTSVNNKSSRNKEKSNKNKKINKKIKRKKLEERIKMANSMKDKNKCIDKKNITEKVKKTSSKINKVDSDNVNEDSNVEKKMREVKKQKKNNDLYRFQRKDIFDLDEDNNILEEIEKSEERKRREKNFSKNETLGVSKKNPDNEFLKKLKKLDTSGKSNKKSINDKLNIEELVLNHVTKHPTSSIISRVTGPYNIEKIEDVLKKHPNVKPVNNKNFDGKVMTNLKRPFWHQIDTIPLIMGRQEDSTDDNLPINSDMLKSYENGKLKVENKINLRPKKPNPFGSLRDIIKQNDMFSIGQIFGNTMRDISKFKPKYITNNTPKIDSMLMLQSPPQIKQNKCIEKIKTNMLSNADDSTAEEEVEGTLKKVIKEPETNMFPILPKTKIIYKRTNPCIWKEVPLNKSNYSIF
uniref:Uncharacterized protein n=1 Tax=Strongyloides stercoralis TaxID=6248 RepID=A0AAF5CZY3_STRER